MTWERITLRLPKAIWASTPTPAAVGVPCIVFVPLFPLITTSNVHSSTVKTVRLINCDGWSATRSHGVTGTVHAFHHEEVLGKRYTMHTQLLEGAQEHPEVGMEVFLAEKAKFQPQLDGTKGYEKTDAEWGDGY